MPKPSAASRAEAKLTQAVASGLLPKPAEERALQILGRLQAPLRLTLMGLPGVGKSSLLNLLVGSDVLDQQHRLPTLSLSYGSAERSICTLSDGSKQTLDTIAGDAIAALSPVFVEMQSPLPALRKISVLEVVAPGEANALHKASQWAAKRSDITLWCTRTFNSQEQTIWAQMPDLTKDHGFLMLTHADLLAAQNNLESVIDALQNSSKHEFNQILPIATTDAISARMPDGTVDKDRLRAAGAIALIQAVRRQVDLGQQSFVDQADILLQQNAKALASLDTPGDSTEAAAAPSSASRVSEPVFLSDPQPVSRPLSPTAGDTAPAEPKEGIGMSRLRALAAKKRAEREGDSTEATPAEVAAPDAPEPQVSASEISAAAIATPPAAETAQSPATGNLALNPATRDAYSRAVAYVTEQGAALGTRLSENGDGAAAEVMAQTVEHLQWLADFLSGHGDDTDVALQQVRETAFDAADLAQLMQMEGRDSAALEAVQLMLQIKRELQADLAA